jgi:Domain of unknown function (DUF1844)
MTDQDRADVTDEDRAEISFGAFVVSLAASAAMQFGDVPGPDGQPIEADLVGAGQLIDILAMLQEKTKGNLTEDEDHLLSNILFELRLRYVEATKPASRIIVP